MYEGAIGIAGYLISARSGLGAQQAAAVSISANDIGGVVSSAKGPEGGVWVIAETTDLPTRYIEEVVTDGRGRGQQCPEGWTLCPTPGPKFKNVKDSGSVDSHYYDWVDRFDTLGLGKKTPIVTGKSSDSLIALVSGKWVILRVPYPIGFFAKGMDGRIDDPKAGWKGKGVWTTWGTRTPFHSETGKGTMPKVVHFQIRPDPLAH